MSNQVFPTEQNSWQPKLRDRVAVKTCNWLLNHVATLEYRVFLGVVTSCGLDKLDAWAEADTCAGGKGTP